MPWKNGGGQTLEIARFPADQEPYLWRLSCARIERDGPFSSFPGFDRRLVVIDGKGLLLNEHALAPFAVTHFPGEAAITARLLAGPVRDLGLIYDRTRIAASLDALTLGPDAIEVRLGPRAVHHLYCVSGRLSVDDLVVGPGETWQSFSEATVRVRGAGKSVLASIFESP